MALFKKILIANRGEIACRIMVTARRMGIRTVAVYSAADRDALHVAMADEAVHIGGEAASESYLRAEKIIDACKQTNAQAVHPGYGFLSENAEFAERLTQSGIVFIGPGAKAIAAMGDKITSKRIAERAGVNIIPGYTDVVTDAQQAVAIAGDIGYPVMIKASAGGGGKGMRIAFSDDECRHGFTRATSEAESSFGDGRVFMEKFIESPRHIEIQLLADAHGSVVALHERECSIQRRHQKVIEEAPSPLLDDTTRRAMGEQAKALARAVAYQSAGTVEFVADGSRNFYFLEMNTRLQVEHPVTEKITGLDLVEMMIRIAAGEPLGITQEEVALKGWAMESRIYAENPYRGFLPSIGRLHEYIPPAEEPAVRVDSGVVEGSRITMHYDPMIAKLVTWGADRNAAIAAMTRALDQYYIRGVDTNIPFLSAIMRHPRFIDGALTTGFIDEEYAEGFASGALESCRRLHIAIVLATIHYRLMQRAATVSGQVSGYDRVISGDWVVQLDDQYIPCNVVQSDQNWLVAADNRTFTVKDRWSAAQRVYSGQVDHTMLDIHIEKSGHGYHVSHGDWQQTVHVMMPQTAELNRLMPIRQEADLSRYLLAPMPGLLVALRVQPGSRVAAGDELAVIEAMKMENVLRAQHDGTVAEVLVNAGDTLEVDQPMLRFESSEPE